MLNLELKSGERIITNGANAEDDRVDFGYIIRDNLGYEAWKEYKDILSDLEYPDGEDWEGIADGYFQEILSAADEMEALRDELGDILDGKRLSRDRLEKLHKALANAAKQIRFNV